MYSTQCYKYEDVKEGFRLICKSGGENIGTNIWLKDSDSQNNYEEVEVKNDNSK